VSPRTQVRAIAEGDVEGLGRVYVEAQAAFDLHAVMTTNLRHTPRVRPPTQRSHKFSTMYYTGLYPEVCHTMHRSYTPARFDVCYPYFHHILTHLLPHFTQFYHISPHFTQFAVYQAPCFPVPSPVYHRFFNNSLLTAPCRM